MDGGTMFKYATIFLAAIFLAIPLTAADAKHKRAHRQQTISPIVCSERGCSDHARVSRPVVDANGGEGAVIGGRPAGCPRAFCGCEASLYLFGQIRPELNLAANWARKFPRSAPAPGMAAVRNGHVMVLISHAGGNDWLVHDGNSGRGLTRRHVRSIRGYVVVDPQGTRSASLDRRP